MSIAKSSFLFAIGTVISRLSGLIRSSVMSYVFGAGVLIDAFYLANRLPNMLREMLAEGALGSSFTKVFTERFEHDKKAAKKLLVDTLWMVTLFMSILVLVGIILAPWVVEGLVWLTRKDVNPELTKQIIGLTRILFPFIALMSLGAIAAGALHQSGRFFLSSVSSIALNVGYIVGALILGPLFFEYGPAWFEVLIADRMISGLAIGVLLGGAGQLGLQLWGIWEPLLKGQDFPLRSLPWSEDIKKILVLMLPMIVASSSSQINVFVNTVFQIGLPSGSVTWYMNAFLLLHLPVAIFGVAIGTAALPALSRSIAKSGRKITDDVSRKFQNSLGLLLWLMVPCFVFVISNGLEMVQLVFLSGKYTVTDAQETANILFIFGFALFGYSANKVFTPFYYAMDRTSFAMKVGMLSIITNFVLNYLLIDKYQILGMALTFAATITINAIILFSGLMWMKLNINAKKAAMHIGFLAIFAVVAFQLQSTFKAYYYSSELVMSHVKLNAFLVLCVDAVIILTCLLLIAAVVFRTNPIRLARQFLAS